MARLIDAEFLEREISKWLKRPGDGEYYCGYDDALTAVQDLVADMPTITPPSEWTSMGDRKPKFPNQTCNEMMVIVCTKNGHVMPMVYTRGQVGDETSDVWLYPWDKIYVGPEITHWMMLPKPPKGEKEELKDASN